MSLTIVMIVTHFNASDEFDARDSALELKSCSQTNVFFGSKQIIKSDLFIRGRKHIQASVELSVPCDIVCIKEKMSR